MKKQAEVVWNVLLYIAVGLIFVSVFSLAGEFGAKVVTVLFIGTGTAETIQFPSVATSILGRIGVAILIGYLVWWLRESNESKTETEESNE
jgi:hypothetical protein